MQRVWPGNEAYGVAVRPHPRAVRAVAEPHVEDHLKPDLARKALYYSDDIAAVPVRWHEVNDAEHAAVALELGLEDQRVASIPLFPLANRRRRPDSPPAVLVMAEKRCEASFRVETGHAHPVDITAS